MITKILNYFSYYKLDQLSPGGNCGLCGKWIDDKVVIKDAFGAWDVCEDCLEGDKNEFAV